ncbi:MAG: ATP-binding protein [Candidatus Dormibacteria bacterium]
MARVKRHSRSPQSSSARPLGLLAGGVDGSAQSQLDFLRAINESLAEGVYATDVDGRFTFVNPAAQRLLGWSGADLLGRHAHSAIHQTEPAGRGDSLAVCPLLGVITSGVPWSGDEQLTRRDGSTFPALISSAPVHSGSRIVGAVVAFRDDSARRESEVRLRQAEDATARQSAAAELARAETHRLAELERTKSHLLQVASHELRSPIAVLAGYLEMLADGSLGVVSPAAERVLPILQSKVAEMNELVNTMLVSVRLQGSSLIPAKVVTVDLCQMAREAAAAPPRSLSPAHRIQVVAPADPVLVLADEAGLRTIVSNLLDNALKYSPAGGDICVEVSARGEWAALGVRDQGLGIAAKHLPMLFSHFGRIVTPENSHIRGAGLGLWQSRELARAQHGDIEVVSEPGRGTTFTVVLRRRTPAG